MWRWVEDRWVECSSRVEGDVELYRIENILFWYPNARMEFSGQTYHFYTSEDEPLLPEGAGYDILYRNTQPPHMPEGIDQAEAIQLDRLLSVQREVNQETGQPEVLMNFSVMGSTFVSYSKGPLPLESVIEHCMKMGLNSVTVKHRGGSTLVSWRKFES